MENGTVVILPVNAELLGTLFKINPGYIQALSSILVFFNATNDIMRIDEEKIASLAKALKRKINSRKMGKK